MEDSGSVGNYIASRHDGARGIVNLKHSTERTRLAALE